MLMEQGLSRAANGRDAPVARSVNGDMRQAAANLALVINECGLSQSELSRRSGVSRQLINGWARQRVSVTLSSTVGQLLSGIQLSLADLLLDQETLYARIGKAPQSAPDGFSILPNLTRLSHDATSRQRLANIVGTFRYKTRLKDNPMFVLERLFQFEARDGAGATVKIFEGVRVAPKTFAEGHCFHHQSMFLIAVECSEPPHQPLIYAFRDPGTPNIRALNGVSIAPDLFGPNAGCPLARLVYLYRANPDGTAVLGDGFNPDAEFNAFIPTDACSVITTY
jgi:transcriptional regulator with XRE-family HTH domain